MSKDFQSQIPFISIVAIVAIVAIVVLLQTFGGFFSSSESSFSPPSNILGQAIAQYESDSNWYYIYGDEEINEWVFLQNVPVYDHIADEFRVLDRSWFFLGTVYVEDGEPAWFYNYGNNWVYLHDDNTFGFWAHDNENQEWRYFTKLESQDAYMYMHEDDIFQVKDSMIEYSLSSKMTLFDRDNEFILLSGEMSISSINTIEITRPHILVVRRMVFPENATFLFNTTDNRSFYTGYLFIEDGYMYPYDDNIIQLGLSFTDRVIEVTDLEIIGLHNENMFIDVPQGGWTQEYIPRRKTFQELRELELLNQLMDEPFAPLMLYEDVEAELDRYNIEVGNQFRIYDCHKCIFSCQDSIHISSPSDQRRYMACIDSCNSLLCDSLLI